MTRTRTHISQIRRGQRFAFSATARTVYTAHNTPKHADARGNYSVRVSPRESVSVPATDATVWVI
jgi:hypothetical protein